MSVQEKLKQKLKQDWSQASRQDKLDFLTFILTHRLEVIQLLIHKKVKIDNKLISKFEDTHALHSLLKKFQEATVTATKATCVNENAACITIGNKEIHLPKLLLAQKNHPDELVAVTAICQQTSIKPAFDKYLAKLFTTFAPHLHQDEETPFTNYLFRLAIIFPENFINWTNSLEDSSWLKKEIFIKRFSSAPAKITASSASPHSDSKAHLKQQKPSAGAGVGAGAGAPKPAAGAATVNFSDFDRIKAEQEILNEKALQALEANKQKIAELKQQGETLAKLAEEQQLEIDSQEAELAELKASHKGRILILKQNHENETAAINKELEASKKSCADSYSRQVQTLRTNLKNKLRSLETTLHNQARMTESEIESRQAEHKARLSAVDRKQQLAVEEVNVNHGRNLEKLKAKYAQTTAQIEVAYREEYQALKEKGDARLQGLERAYQTRIAEINSQQVALETAFRDGTKALQTKINDLRAVYSKEYQQLVSLRQTYAKELIQYNSLYAKVEQLMTDRTHLFNQIAQAKIELEKTYLQAKSSTDARVLELEKMFRQLKQERLNQLSKLGQEYTELYADLISVSHSLEGAKEDSKQLEAQHSEIKLALEKAQQQLAAARTEIAETRIRRNHLQKDRARSEQEESKQSAEEEKPEFTLSEEKQALINKVKTRLSHFAREEGEMTEELLIAVFKLIYAILIPSAKASHQVIRNPSSQLLSTYTTFRELITLFDLDDEPAVSAWREDSSPAALQAAQSLWLKAAAIWIEQHNESDRLSQRLLKRLFIPAQAIPKLTPNVHKQLIGLAKLIDAKTNGFYIHGSDTSNAIWNSLVENSVDSDAKDLDLVITVNPEDFSAENNRELTNLVASALGGSVTRIVSCYVGSESEYYCNFCLTLPSGLQLDFTISPIPSVSDQLDKRLSSASGGFALLEIITGKVKSSIRHFKAAIKKRPEEGLVPVLALTPHANKEALSRNSLTSAMLVRPLFKPGPLQSTKHCFASDAVEQLYQQYLKQHLSQSMINKDLLHLSTPSRCLIARQLRTELLKQTSSSVASSAASHFSPAIPSANANTASSQTAFSASPD